ncbi:MAG: class I SAM-dependent methyltransferase, partial [Anaerolineales bacterium]
GIDLTAVDLSAPSLAYARQKARDLPICWVEADVRDFHLQQRYDFIFARGGVFDFCSLAKTKRRCSPVPKSI